MKNPHIFYLTKFMNLRVEYNDFEAYYDKLMSLEGKLRKQGLREDTLITIAIESKIPVALRERLSNPLVTNWEDFRIRCADHFRTKQAEYDRKNAEYVQRNRPQGQNRNFNRGPKNFGRTRPVAADAPDRKAITEKGETPRINLIQSDLEEPVKHCTIPVVLRGRIGSTCTRTIVSLKKTL